MSGRPEVLFPLFATIKKLDGIGPKTAQNLAHIGIETPRDLIMTLPLGGIDRHQRGSIRDVGVIHLGGAFVAHDALAWI